MHVISCFPPFSISLGATELPDSMPRANYEGIAITARANQVLLPEKLYNRTQHPG